MQVQSWGVHNGLKLFGKPLFNRTAIKQRLMAMCQEIHEQAEGDSHLIFAVVDTLEIIGIFTDSEIEEITTFKPAPEAERTEPCNLQIVTTS